MILKPFVLIKMLAHWVCLIVEMFENLIQLFFFFFFFSGCAMQFLEILVPWPEIEPMASKVKAWGPNHWTTREVPGSTFYIL